VVNHFLEENKGMEETKGMEESKAHYSPINPEER